jgi:DNA polymerase III sliding clamp (beta) subunit (PCNA family)
MLIDREVFAGSLARVKPALSSGGVVKELTYLWFDKKHVLAYDGGFGIQLKLATELECGVPGRVLTDLLSTSPLKEATLEPNGEALNVKFGRSTSKVAVLDASSKVWPFPGKLPRNAEPTALDENFMEALRKTLFVKASPATRVEHHGVLVQKQKKDLVLYSTDSATMAQAVVKGAGAGVGFEKTLLPRAFAEQLVAQTPEGVDLYVLDDCLIAAGEGVTFYSNVLDLSAAHDLAGVVASTQKAQPEGVDLPAGLQEALDRAIILAAKDPDGPIISLGVDRGKLTILGDYNLGKLDEQLELEGTHPNGRLKIKATLLARALAYGEQFSLNENALVLSSPGFTYIVASL